MSLRNEQCNKVCRILDDVLANRPTERDSLIAAVRKAFGALETEPNWIPCSEKLPERNGYYLVTGRQGAVNKRLYQDGYWYGNWTVFAWMPLPEPYRAERRTDD